jgi:DMSO/TMAO reductase YedYZ molybdopterin-dependent catalytic subunit
MVTERTSEPPAGIAADDAITVEELQLAARNHGMPLEGLRYDVTPIGMHYLLTHFDIPPADEASWSVAVDGLVDRRMTLSLEDLRARPAVTQVVTMECAGNGRARLHPRPLSQPWLVEAVGTAAWTGTPLAPILREAGLGDDAVELVFTGADHGTQGGVEHDYQRSLPVADALRDEVLLAYEVNGQPLPPQHGFPVRLLVPGWYGMTSVKWLTRIEAVAEPFDGFQQWAYRLRQREEDEGVPVTRMEPRALMIPPGFPEFFTRTRTVDAGPVRLEGRAWSGAGAVTAVEISTDGGATWSGAELGAPAGSFAWQRWSWTWSATPGEHELVVRATDGDGLTQPLTEPWNHHGLANNLVQRVPVTVRPSDPD